MPVLCVRAQRLLPLWHFQQCRFYYNSMRQPHFSILHISAPWSPPADSLLNSFGRRDLQNAESSQDDNQGSERKMAANKKKKAKGMGIHSGGAVEGDPKSTKQPENKPVDAGEPSSFPVASRYEDVAEDSNEADDIMKGNVSQPPGPADVSDNIHGLSNPPKPLPPLPIGDPQHADPQHHDPQHDDEGRNHLGQEEPLPPNLAEKLEAFRKDLRVQYDEHVQSLANEYESKHQAEVQRLADEYELKSRTVERESDYWKGHFGSKMREFEAQDKRLRDLLRATEKKLDNCVAVCNDYENSSQESNKALTEVKSENAKLKLKFTKIIDDRLASVDRFQPMTDSMLEKYFELLRSPVSKLGRTLAGFCRGDIGTKTFQGTVQGCSLTPDITSIAWSQEKSAIAESIIWRYLLEDVFDKPLQSFKFDGVHTISRSTSQGQAEEQTQSVTLEHFRNRIFLQKENTKALSLNREYLMWRHITVTYLLGAPSENKALEIERRASIAEKTVDAQAKVKQSMMDCFTSLVPSEDLAKVDKDVGKIVEMAASVAGVFIAQRCDLELWAPFRVYKEGKQKRYNDEYHEKCRDATDTNQEVDFVVSPALIKHGNGHGENLDSEAVIVKAQVMMLMKDAL